MKNLISTIFLFSLLICNAQAGLWDIVTTAGVGYIGGKAAQNGSSSCAAAPVKETRAKKVNNHLWGMHKSGLYDDDYKFYLDFLEGSEEYKNSIHYADTVAWVYFDFGDYKKTVQIYEENVIPWIQFEPSEDQRRYRSLYSLFKEREACYFNCEGIEIKAKESEEFREGEIKDHKAKTRTEKAGELLKKSEEGIKKLGGKLKEKVEEVIDK